MYKKLAGALRNLHRGQRGITGLETAIILIAFVTVASIVAYSVLSAGVYSAEKSKETVFMGVKQAQGTVAVKGNQDNGGGCPGRVERGYTYQAMYSPIDYMENACIQVNSTYQNSH